MPYLDHQPEETWQKRLFDKLKNVEDKLDRLLVLREQEIDTTIRRYDCPPTFETRISGHHRRIPNFKDGAKNHLQLGLGRENPLSQSQWPITFPSRRDR